jgi:hypothetical protein
MTVFWLCASLAACACSSAQDGGGITARMEMPRSHAYVGECFPIVLSVEANGVRLGQDLSLLNLPPSDQLALSEFEELQPERSSDGTREKRRFQALARTPREGRVSVAPVLRVRVVIQRRMLLGSSWTETTHEVRVEPVNLDVRQLPSAGRPANYSGAIGQFDFDVWISPTNIVPGDLVRADMTVRGIGSTDGITLPAFSPGRSFKTYEPRIVSSKEGRELSVQQILIPQSTNAVMLPEIAFCYFDPGPGAYRTLTHGPFGLGFHAPDAVAFQPFQRTASQESPKAAPVADSRRKRVSPETVVFLSYWATAVALALAFGGRTGRGALKAALILAIASAGFFPLRRSWHERIGGPVMVAPDVMPARLAPGPEASETFRIAAGAKFRVQDEYRGWFKVRAGDSSGWIPKDAVGTLPGAIGPARERTESDRIGRHRNQRGGAER